MNLNLLLLFYAKIYPPKQFFIHLYNLCVTLDENVQIEVTYEDETYSPIGAIAVKKDKDEI